MAEPDLVGGTEADRRALLRLHEAYLEANASFDWQKLRDIWGELPEATFFNLNGHTYRGKEHWIRLWKFYRQNVRSSYWTPYELGGAVTRDMAVLWCHRKTRREWTGTAPPPRDIHYGGDEFVSRSTLVFLKSGDDWRVIHAHFSEAASGPRPGGV